MKSSPSLLILICTVAVAFVWSVQLLRSDTLTRPPIDHDGVYFEALATNLSLGRGFSGEFDQDVTEEYRPFAGNSAADFILDGGYADELEDRGLNEVTTFRPPVYPWLLSLLYKIFGRDFSIFKIANLTFMSIGCFFVFRRLDLIAGVPAVLCGFVLLAIDQFVFQCITLCLSEALAFLFVVLLFELLLSEQPRMRQTILIALLVATAALTRSVFFLWIPTLAVGAAILVRDRGRSDRVLLAISLVALPLIFSSPWMLRNVRVLQAPMPLGSQGGIVLATIYNDRGLENWGNWTVEEHLRFFDSYQGSEQGRVRERELSIWGRDQALRWISENPATVPLLATKRILSLWWIHATMGQKLLIFLAFVGCWWFRKERAIAVVLIFALAHTAAIAATTSIDNGRYLFTLHPLLLIGAALALTRLLESATAARTRRQTQQKVP